MGCRSSVLSPAPELLFSEEETIERSLLVVVWGCLDCFLYHSRYYWALTEVLKKKKKPKHNNMSNMCWSYMFLKTF